MSFKNKMMASAGVIAAALLSVPAYAQSDNYYNTNPTPTERAQTGQLNSDAAADATQSTDANDAARAAYDANSAQYQDQLDRYRSQQEDYARARASYERERAGYVDPARRWDAFYGHDTFQDVSVVSTNALVGRPLIDESGNEVGRIHDVDRGDHFTRVGVRESDGDMAWIPADHVRYDPDAGVAVTDFTPRDIHDAQQLSHPRM